MPIHLFNWPLVRTLAWAKRAVVALEDLRDGYYTVHRLAVPRSRRPTRHIEHHVPSVGDWNAARERERREAAEL